MANLGYAEGRWLKPVYPGDTLRSVSEVIGLKQNSNGKSGVVWVRTRGFDQVGEPVLEYVRWVMVRKNNLDAPAPETAIPELKGVLEAGDLIIPEALNFEDYDFTLAGEPHRWGDYEIGEKIDHVDGVTVEEAEHMMATRLWAEHSESAFRRHLPPRRAAADLWRARDFDGAGIVVQRLSQRPDDRGSKRRRTRKPLLLWRHNPSLVRGSGQG